MYVRMYMHTITAMHNICTHAHIELINPVEKIIKYHMAGYEGCNF